MGDMFGLVSLPRDDEGFVDIIASLACFGIGFNSSTPVTLLISSALKIAGIAAKEAGYKELGTALNIASIAVPIVVVSVPIIDALIWALSISPILVV